MRNHINGYLMPSDMSLKACFWEKAKPWDLKKKSETSVSLQHHKYYITLFPGSQDEAQHLYKKQKCRDPVRF